MQGRCPSDHDYGKIVQQFQKAEEIQEKRCLGMSCAINNIVCISSGSIVVRVAHFLVENQETGNERPGNFLQKIALFLETFLVLTKIW